MSQKINIDQIKKYFGEKLENYGATPQGADWNSIAAQYTRFDQLVKGCDLSQKFSIIDYGCAYGALIDYLLMRGCKFDYTGFDIVEDMVTQAGHIHQDKPFCTFTHQVEQLTQADYVVESGIFNIRLDYDEAAWRDYVIETLDRMNSLSGKCFAFNMLTSYSDPEYMKPHLYYADPRFYFDYCKLHYSKNVALLHDYNLYDFTILVRKIPPQSA